MQFLAWFFPPMYLLCIPAQHLPTPVTVRRPSNVPRCTQNFPQLSAYTPSSKCLFTSLKPPHLPAAPGGLHPHICHEGLSASFGLTADLRSHRGGRPVLPEGLCDHFQSGPKECLPTPAPQPGRGGDVQAQRPEGRHGRYTTSRTILGVTQAQP